MQPVGATPITVENAGFEDPSLADGAAELVNIPFWANQSVNAMAGIQNLQNADFPGATDGGGATSLAEGRNTAFCATSASFGLGELSQVLPANLQPNTHYVLHVAVGLRGSDAWPGYRVQLWAGGQLLAEDNNTVEPQPGEFVTSILHFESGFDHKQLTQPLAVHLLAGGEPGAADNAQVQFDCVQLYTWAVNSTHALQVAAPKVALRWDDVPGSTGYIVERSLGRRTGPFSVVAELAPDANDYVDDDPALEPATTYYYRLLLSDLESVRSSPMGVTTLNLP